MNVFTFWEGPMPGYIKLCLETWRVPYTLLNYNNLHQYTDLPISKLRRFSIEQACDCVKAHVLRDNGGIWLDADSIMVTGKMPNVTVLGNVELRTNTIAFLQTEPQSEMFVKWAKYQDKVLDGDNASTWWALMGNAFTDSYIREHKEIKLGSIYDYWLETDNEEDRPRKYVDYYFNNSYKPNMPDLIILHNSWTPAWYKDMPMCKVLDANCTLSNVLREAL